MQIQNMNWFEVEEYLKSDDRVVISLGSVEQHGYLSLAVDHILSSKLAQEAGERCNIPVFPGLPYGIAPYFSAFPGTITISPVHYFNFVCDMLTSLYRQGFKRIFIVNGHGGNSPVQAQIQHWLIDHEDCQVVLHNWWASTKVMQHVKSISPIASHASWMENFPWTRLTSVILPDEEKPMINIQKISTLGPKKTKKYIGDGNYGGRYFVSDEIMNSIWETAVAETVEIMSEGWE